MRNELIRRRDLLKGSAGVGAAIAAFVPSSAQAIHVGSGLAAEYDRYDGLGFGGADRQR